MRVNLLLQPNYAGPAIPPGVVRLPLSFGAQAPLILEPGERAVLPTGLRLEIPEGFEGQVRPTVNLAARGIGCLNSPGTIDADYRGEVSVLLINMSDGPATIDPGAEIGILAICEIVRADWQVVNELPNTDRADGGFGSTGQ